MKDVIQNLENWISQHKALSPFLVAAFSFLLGVVLSILVFLRRHLWSAVKFIATPILTRLSASIAIRKYKSELVNRTRTLVAVGDETVDLQRHYVPTGVSAENWLPPNELGQDEVLASGSDRESVNVMDLLMGEDSGRLIIAGEPGSGKSLLLQYIAFRVSFPPIPRLRLLFSLLARHHYPFWRQRLKYYRFARRAMPVLTTATALGRSSSTLVDHLGALMSLPGMKRALRQALRKGRVMVLIDAFDEVPSRDFRNAVVEKLRAFTQDSGSAANQVVLTSRTASCPLVPGFSIRRIAALNSQGIVELIRRRYVNRYSASSLVAKLRQNPDLWGLASNPLLCHLMTVVDRQEIELPTNRADLYAKASRVLLRQIHRSYERRVPCMFSEDDKSRALELISYHVQTEPAMDITMRGMSSIVRQSIGDARLSDSATNLVEEIIETTGIIRPKGIDTFDFLHKTFQEYHCAKHLVGLQAEQQLTILSQHILDPKWREVHLLVCTLAPEPAKILAHALGSLSADVGYLLSLLQHSWPKAGAVGTQIAQTVSQLVAETPENIGPGQGVILGRADPDSAAVLARDLLNDGVSHAQIRIAFEMLSGIGTDQAVDEIVQHIRSRPISYAEVAAFEVLGSINSAKARSVLVSSAIKATSVPGMVAACKALLLASEYSHFRQLCHEIENSTPPLGLKIMMLGLCETGRLEDAEEAFRLCLRQGQKLTPAMADHVLGSIRSTTYQNPDLSKQVRFLRWSWTWSPDSFHGRLVLTWRHVGTIRLKQRMRQKQALQIPALYAALLVAPTEQGDALSSAESYEGRPFSTEELLQRAVQIGATEGRSADYDSHLLGFGIVGAAIELCKDTALLPSQKVSAEQTVTHAIEVGLFSIEPVRSKQLGRRKSKRIRDYVLSLNWWLDDWLCDLWLGSHDPDRRHSPIPIRFWKREGQEKRTALSASKR